MAADALATPGARASAAMVLSYFSDNIPGLALTDLTSHPSVCCVLGWGWLLFVLSRLMKSHQSQRVFSTLSTSGYLEISSDFVWITSGLQRYGSFQYVITTMLWCIGHLYDLMHKMADVQPMFPKAFSWKKKFVFWIRFQLSLYVRILSGTDATIVPRSIDDKSSLFEVITWCLHQ